MSDFSIPSEWILTELGNYIYLKNGFAFKSSDYLESSQTTIPIIRISDIQNNLVTTDSATHVLPNKLAESFTISRGDLLIAMSGATTGKVGIFNESKLAYQNQRVGNLKLINEELGNKSFRNYLIQSLSKKILEIAYGGAQPNISGKTIEEILIPLPPKAEQEKIAELLDSQLAQVETIKSQLNAIPDILKKFRQSVLADAVSGRLTEEWRKQYSYSAEHEYQDYLLNEDNSDKIVKEKIKLRKEPKFVKENDNIQSWITLPFFEFALLNRGFDLPSSQRNEGKYKIISSSGYNGTHESFTVKAPCITVGRSGNVGKVFYYDEDCWALNTTLYVKSFGFSDPKFIYWKLKSLNLEQYSSSTAVPTLNRNEFMFEPISIPPIEEQKEIVERVEQLFTYADTIEIQLTHALQRVNQLTQSILHQAFTGKLTAHWRTQNPHLITGDNSATALLAQIQTAKQKATPTKNPKR